MSCVSDHVFQLAIANNIAENIYNAVSRHPGKTGVKHLVWLRAELCFLEKGGFATSEIILPEAKGSLTQTALSTKCHKLRSARIALMELFTS